MTIAARKVLTAAAGGGEIGGMGRAVKVERMMVRLKRPQIGDVVRVRDCEIYFHLPEGLPDKTDAVYVGHESGRYIVRALGRDWNIPMQCIEHDEEMLLGGRWLDKWDRRVRRVKMLIDRLDAVGARSKSFSELVPQK